MQGRIIILEHCTTLLLNMIYPPMKFQVEILFEICSGQKCQTEGRTDGRKDGDYYYIPAAFSAGDKKNPT
jgi:hypothetical protein